MLWFLILLLIVLFVLWLIPQTKISDSLLIQLIAINVVVILVYFLFTMGASLWGK